MTEKGPDHAYTEQELNLLRLALTEAAAVRSTEAERMTTELEVRKRRHATALASLRAAVETAQGNLAAAEAHNARVEKRHAYWLERFSHHCHHPDVKSEEELHTRLRADMMAFQG